MKISVIIPTYRRPLTLLQALRSLQKQTLAEFEILVVDNAAEPEISRQVSEFNKIARIPVRYVAERRTGVHYARNTAAETAEGDLLLYTDDDVSFEPGWAEAYDKAFADHPKMAAAGGPVRPIWEQPPPQWLISYIGDSKCFVVLSLMEPYDKFQVSEKGYFFSCNMAIWKSVLKARGGFDPEATANAWIGDGESGLNRRMWANGDQIGYLPDAVVYHHIPPSRMTVEYFCHRMANEGACDMYAYFHHHIPDRLRLCKHAAAIAIRSCKCWVHALLVRNQTDIRSLNIQMHSARTRSQLKYIARLMFDRGFQELVAKENWL
jgi:glycosyltransferase involved in cell wall biosynthesis